MKYKIKTIITCLAAILVMPLASCEDSGGFDPTPDPDNDIIYCNVTFDANGGYFSNGASRKTITIEKGFHIDEIETPTYEDIHS